MFCSVATLAKERSMSSMVTPFFTLRSHVVATAMSPSESTQRSHIFEASEPAPLSRLPTACIVPHPLNPATNAKGFFFFVVFFFFFCFFFLSKGFLFKLLLDQTKL